MDPEPPVSRVPPMTTAAIACSSRPTPIVDWPDDDRAATSTPARPARRPLVRYIAILTRAMGSPMSRAASSLPPIAVTAMP